MKTRSACVAGKFYEGEKRSLIQQIENILRKEEKNIANTNSEKNVLGGVVPHAGYMFSAYQAVHYFRALAQLESKPDVFIIINPNHRGIGPPIALDENDVWESPFGEVEIDMEFYAELGFEKDAFAHEYEHSGEVMLPLLQYFISHQFKIVPITLTKQTPESAELLATRIFEVKKKLNRNINIIASSDFSHYVSPEEGKMQDDFAVQQILKLNATGMFHEIKDNAISACGYGPIMSLIYYTNLVTKNGKVDVLKRGHSGEIIPSNEVVHYISMLFYEEN
jgi:MEMO1 family protein